MMRKTKKNLSSVYWKLQEAIKAEELYAYTKKYEDKPTVSVNIVMLSFLQDGFSRANLEYALELLRLHAYCSREYDRLMLENKQPFQVAYSYAASANFVWSEIRELFLHPSTSHRNLTLEIDSATWFASISVKYNQKGK